MAPLALGKLPTRFRDATTVAFVATLAVICVFVMSISVCVSVREHISGVTLTIFTKFFVHVAYVRGLVLLQHVDYRPHRLLAGRG